MSKDRALQQLDFVLQDRGRKVTFSLIPLKKKTSVNIFHNILLAVLESIGSLLKEDSSDDDFVEAITKSLKSLDFDQFWFIAERIFKFAVVDDSESKRLEDAEWWQENPLLLYRATFEGVKLNYPEVFTGLGLKDLFRGKGPDEKETPHGDTPEQK